MVSITSEGVCEALLTFFAFSFPQTILSDNRPQLASNLFAKVSAMLGIKHKFCSFYHAALNVKKSIVSLKIYWLRLLMDTQMSGIDTYNL